MCLMQISPLFYLYPPKRIWKYSRSQWILKLILIGVFWIPLYFLDLLCKKFSFLGLTFWIVFQFARSSAFIRNPVISDSSELTYYISRSHTLSSCKQIANFAAGKAEIRWCFSLLGFCSPAAPVWWSERRPQGRMGNRIQFVVKTTQRPKAALYPGHPAQTFILNSPFSQIFPQNWFFGTFLDIL